MGQREDKKKKGGKSQALAVYHVLCYMRKYLLLKNHPYQKNCNIGFRTTRHIAIAHRVPIMVTTT